MLHGRDGRWRFGVLLRPGVWTLTRARGCAPGATYEGLVTDCQSLFVDESCKKKALVGCAPMRGMRNGSIADWMRCGAR